MWNLHSHLHLISLLCRRNSHNIKNGRRNIWNLHWHLNLISLPCRITNWDIKEISLWFLSRQSLNSFNSDRIRDTIEMFWKRCKISGFFFFSGETSEFSISTSIYSHCCAEETSEIVKSSFGGMHRLNSFNSDRIWEIIENL